MVARTEAVLDPFEGTCYILTAGREDAAVACTSVVGNYSDEASGLDIVSCLISLHKLALCSHREIMSDVCIDQSFGCGRTRHTLITPRQATSIDKDQYRRVIRNLLWCIEVKLLTRVRSIFELFSRCRLDVASVLFVENRICLHRWHQGREDGASECW